MNPMTKYFDKICSDHPDGFMVVLQFKSSPQAVQGALRKVKDVDGLFELLGPGQVGDPQNPKVPKNVLVSNFFSVDAVERVIVFQDIPQPQIVTPQGSGGIIIPS